MIPFLKVANWNPGATLETKVHIDEMETGRRILFDVPLRVAQLIVACVNHCAEEQVKLNNIAESMLRLTNITCLGHWQDLTKV